MKIFKKKSLIFLLAAAAAVFMTSCSGFVSDKNSDKVTLSIMGKESDLNKSYMTKIFDMYEKSTGNELDIISFEDSEYETEAVKMFAEGDVPDVFLHFHNADLNRFNVADNFLYLNSCEWVGDLTDGASAYCRDKDGNLLGLPFWENSVSGCYYNKTILDGLGLKPATNQAEFDVLCQVLADTGYTPICWPADGCSWMAQFGLDPIFADDPALLENLNKNEVSYADIPEVNNMIDWIAGAADKGWFGTDYLETGWSDISPAIGSGEAVMTFIWDTWFDTDFEPGGKYSKEDFAVMPVFMNTADSGTYEGGNLNMMMVNKNSENLDSALDFLEFCATPENYNKAFDGISTVNCFNGQTTNIQSKPVIDAAASIAANERVSTAASRINGYSADDVAAALYDMLSGKTDARECIKRMDEYRITEAQNQVSDEF